MQSDKHLYLSTTTLDQMSQLILHSQFHRHKGPCTSAIPIFKTKLQMLYAAINETTPFREKIPFNQKMPKH